MSNLYKKYVVLKIQDSSKLYLFEVGIFYLFLDEDAKLMSKILGLKLSKLNSVVLKCGFPVNASNKYFNLLKHLDYDIEVIPANDEISSTNIKNYIAFQNFCNIMEDFLRIDIDNISISQAFNEVCKNTKNKKKVEFFKEYKCTYISRIYNILHNEQYKVGPYNIFTIYEPKQRRIVSQNMQDKLINHLVARYILYPAILPCLLDFNVASRKNMGTKRALDLYKKYRNYFSSRFGTYYILKCDISKFFASIDHDILKNKLKRRIKDKKALKIVFDIIDSDSEGLSIGNMTSQVLAIFYLNDMDHFIKETLKIHGFIRYQDDFLLFHQSKVYLKYCLQELTIFLDKENLKLNKKTRIYKNTDNFIFLGRNKAGNYAL